MFGLLVASAIFSFGSFYMVASVAFQSSKEFQWNMLIGFS